MANPFLALPWWGSLAFIVGGGGMGAFVTSVVPEELHKFAFLACAVLVVIGLLSGLPKLWGALWKTRSRMGIVWAFLACFFAVATIGSAILAYRSFSPAQETTPRESDPLRWSFLALTSKNKNFLMGKTTDYGVEVRGFQATGKNEAGKFLKGLRGHIESLRNGKTYPLYIVDRNDLVPLGGYGVPVGNQFMIRAPFFDGEGIPVVQFLSEFGALTFVFEYNNTTYTHSFSAEEVEAQAQWLEQELKPKPQKSEAGVIPLPERRISEQQKRTIAETLKESDWHPDSVWLRYFSPCEECRRYALALKQALTESGWHAGKQGFGQSMDQREDLLSLKLHVADLNAKPPTAVLLALALEKASISFDWSPWPEMGKDRTVLFAYPRD